MKLSDVEKQAKFIVAHESKYKCGHTQLVSNRKGRAICKWCKNYIFVNKEAELKYRNKEMLIKAKRELEDKK